MILCAIIANEGRLSRYETGGEGVRLTHRYQNDVWPCTFNENALDVMREGPLELRVATEEPFTPTPTPPNAASARAA